MSNVHKCAVRSCQSGNNKLFRCPQSREQCKQWKSVLGISDKEFYVCELHFDEQFISYEKVLRNEAVPMIFINDNLPDNQFCACCSSPVSVAHQIGQLHLEIHRMLFSNFDLNGEFICSSCNDRMIGISDFIKIVENNQRHIEAMDDVDVPEPTIKIETIEYEVLLEQEGNEDEENMLQSSQSIEEELQPKRSKLLKISWFKCEVCASIFNTKSDISDHVFSSHAFDHETSHTAYQRCDIKCPECEKKVKYYTYKSHYSSIHSEKRDLMCDQCAKGFALKSALYSHIKLVHDRTAYLCDICGFTCWAKYSIKKHLNQTHNSTYIQKSKNDASKCPICLRICSTNLDQHMHKYHPNNYDSGARVNPETNKFHCPKCIQAFLSLHHYEQHVQGDVCLNFEKYEVEDDKKLTTSTLGRFTCSICKSVKPTLVKLRRHITTFHSGERTCLICSKTQKNKKQFQKHVNSYHKITMKEYKTKATELGHKL